jgi:hypothetical protein
MNFRKYLFGLLLFSIFFIGSKVYAQDIYIKGRVTDASTNEPIPFANIKLSRYFSGISTDFEGYYSIKTNVSVDSISASSLGYRSKSKRIKNKTNQTIDFQLVANTLGIKEVVVFAGVNPAIAIIKTAQAKRPSHNKINSVEFEFCSYTKIQVDVDNVSQKLRKLKILSPITSLFDSLAQSVGEDGDLHLPVLYTENLSDVFIQNKPLRRKKEIIKATKVNAVGIRTGMATSQLTGNTLQDYNFNDNRIGFFGKDFLSPIADNALVFYQFYLVDSVNVNGAKCYLIKVKPKNNQDLLFTGNIWIESKTYAIKQLDLSIPKTANINFIERILIQQELTMMPSGVCIPSKTRLVFDFADLTKNFVGMVATIYNSSYQIKEGQIHDSTFFDRPVVLNEDALVKADTFWQANRPEQLNNSDRYVYNMIDSLKEIPIVKFGVNSFYTVFTGHYTIGKIDYGNVLNVLSYNNIEGYKYRIGARTNFDFSDRLIFRTYLAYGQKDQRFKYNFQAEYLLSRKRWTKLGLNRRVDIDQVGNDYKYDDTQTFSSEQSFLYNATSQINRFALLTLKKENRIWLTSEYNNGLTGRITLQNIAYHNFLDNVTDSNFNALQKDFTSSEIILEGRYAHNEVKIIDDNKRYTIERSRYPVLIVGLKLGIKNILNSDYNYTSLYFNINHKLRLGVLGNSRYTIRGGKIFTPVPYSLLDVPRGNQTPFFAAATFNLMNYFEFINDQYLSIDYAHNFGGLIFNRVPLFKKLKLREVIAFRAVSGSLSQANRIPAIVNTFGTLGKKPYMEASFGFSNLFKVVRIDFIYRLSYTNSNYINQYNAVQKENGIDVPYQISRFGMKVSLDFDL